VGTDGKDIGADVEAVNAATAGVVTGTPPSDQAPFTGTPFAVPGTFAAEDFDLGGESVAYHDNVPGNAGGLYRTGEDVDIIAAPGNATGHVVNNIETGEWLEYTIDVAPPGRTRSSFTPAASSRTAASTSRSTALTSPAP
jgi:hypothetical protein